MQVPEATAAQPPNKWQHPATITTKPPIQPKPSTATAHIATPALTATAPKAPKPPTATILIATTALTALAPNTPKPPTALAHIATTGLMETAPKAWEGMAATAKPRQPKQRPKPAVTTAQQA